MDIRPAPQFKTTEVVTVEDQGVYIVPSVAQECAQMRVVVQVIRDRSNKSLNTKLLPDRSFYGYANTIINARVLKTVQLEYGKQVVYEFDNIRAQIAMQIHCSTENINENLGVLYQGLSSPVPGPAYPTYTAFFLQPPWLPRVPLDEVWLQVDGGCKLAVWCEYQEIDFLCESARNKFIPKDNDREDDKGLPNPTGQGQGEKPLGGGQDLNNPAPRNGDGNGGSDPSVGTFVYYLEVTVGTRSGATAVYRDFGPYPTPPSFSYGANRNTPPVYSVELTINGVYIGLDESYGVAPQRRIVRVRQT